MKVKVSFICFICALNIFSLPAHSDDGCDEILSQGIRNTFQETRGGDFKSQFRNQYCNKQSSGTTATSGQSFGGSYGGVGLNFGSNSGDTAESRSENCGDSNSQMSDSKLYSAMQKVADQGIVNAWNLCKSQPYGLIILGELNEDDLTIMHNHH